MRKPSRIKTLAALILGLALAAGLPSTAAGASDWPRPDAAESYRLIGPAGAAQAGCGRADSAPAGTPECALASLLACFARRDEALCRAVWPAAAPQLFTEAQRWQAYWWSWRIAAVEVMNDSEGAISVLGRSCGLLKQPPDCRVTPSVPTRYRLKRQGEGWIVQDWASPPGN